MENFIKDPEKKITSATKLLNDISSKLNRGTTELSKEFSKVRNLEKNNDTLLFNILDLQQEQIKKSQKVKPQQSLAPSRPSTAEEEKPDSSFGAAVTAAMGAGAITQQGMQPGEDGRTTPMISEGGVSPDSYIFSGFGMRTNPITGKNTQHKGIDISGGPFQDGSPFSVIQPGSVHYIGKNTNGGFGNYVIIKHDNGLYSLYGHMKQIYVKRGDPVGKSGESTVIGTVGSTGDSTGPHIHFELAPRESGNYLDGQFDPRGSVKNYIRGGGKVKIRPQSQQPSSVNPKPQNQASTNQLQPVALNKSNTNLLASQQVSNSVPMNTEPQSTSTSIGMEAEKQSEKLLYQLALAVKTK